MSIDDIDRLIKKTFKKDKDEYNDGYCVEMALALKSMLKGSKLLVGFRSCTNEGEPHENPLSHVVTEWKGETFDAYGKGAIEEWESIYENPYNCGGDTDVEFSWDEYSEQELKKLVRTQRFDRPEIDQEFIKDLIYRIKKCGRSNKTTKISSIQTIQ